VEELLGWITDTARWQGPDAIPVRLLEHVALSATAVVAAALLALPAGLFVGHTGRGVAAVVIAANLGRAVPSFALLLFFFPFFGLGPLTAFLPLLLLAIPPIVTNSYVAVRDVDSEVVEAARGTGMSERQILVRVELPIALSVVLAGVRTSALQVVATATLAAVVAGGGLGRYIIDGFARQEYGTRLLAGAVLVAGLALLTDRLLGRLERSVVSPGLRLAAIRE